KESISSSQAPQGIENHFNANSSASPFGKRIAKAPRHLPRLEDIRLQIYGLLGSRDCFQLGGIEVLAVGEYFQFCMTVDLGVCKGFQAIEKTRTVQRLASRSCYLVAEAGIEESDKEDECLGQNGNGS